MSYRDIALREMGLTPLWVSRAVTTVTATAAVSTQASTSPALAEPDASYADVKIEIAGMDWERLQSEVSDCQRCGLCATRKQTVFGVGQVNARWMLIGEAPGAEEDAQGEPFVGQAGRLLDNMLTAIKLSRQTDVFITNVLKCRPPGNRNPEAEEVRQCEPYLLRQIALVQPELIVVLGRFAVQSLLNTTASIASLRGRVHQTQFGEVQIPVVVTYHPAYLLRNLPDKAKAWADLSLLNSLIKKLND